jgi:hypothetical protein
MPIRKRANKPADDDDLRPEYDFSALGPGVRGKYLERARQGTNLVLLDPDVAKAFPTQDSVNRALRLLSEVAAATSKRRRGRSEHGNRRTRPTPRERAG